MVKKWNFEEEGESIQWACLGELEQINYQNTPVSHSATNYTSADNLPTPPVSHDRLTFGPFTRRQINTKPDPGVHEKVPAIFVFLRSIGKIYLLNGMDYTFSLPFIVRKAWPISPHGVIIQRVLEPTEIVEADLSGDAVLPTIFSVTSPFSEAAAVGLTAGILGPTPDNPAALIDEDENSTRPLKSIPPTEMIIWASHCNIISDAHILVTVDVEKQQLTVWRYVYIRPKDTPAPLCRAYGTSSTNNTQKRQSMSGVGSRRTSALFDGRDRLHPMSPSARTQEVPLIPDSFEFPEVPSLSSLPGMAPALSSTTTMASLVSGGTSSQSRAGPVKGRRNSLSRNDLSMTLDRMALGGRLESDITLTPIEHGRMKAAYWMENLVTHSIEKEEYVLFLFAIYHFVLRQTIFTAHNHGVVYQRLYSTIAGMANALAVCCLSAFLPVNLCSCSHYRKKKIGPRKCYLRRKCLPAPLLRFVLLGRMFGICWLSSLWERYPF